MTALLGQSLRKHARMSTTALEAAVMDRIDEGMKPRAIAAEIGVKLRTVECVLGYMRLGRADVLQSPPTIAASSKALIAAIARAYPEKLSTKKEKTMLNYRQGDVPLVPFTGALDAFKLTEPEAGKLVLALGEATGHHHRIEGCDFAFDAPDNHRLWRDPMTGAQVLEVGGGGASLLHEEHETIDLPTGRYLQLVQVEDDGEMISQVID